MLLGASLHYIIDYRSSITSQGDVYGTVAAHGCSTALVGVAPSVRFTGPPSGGGAGIRRRWHSSDTSGAVVAETDITLTNTQTGESRRATTNDDGQYAIPSVRAATYQLTAEKAGFQKHVVDDLKLEVELVRTVDVVLSVGAVADQVSVVAAAAQLQAADSTVSTLFETKVVNELPLNGRNFLQLQLLAPGVTMGRPGTFSAVQIAAQNTSIGGGNFSVNGMRDVYNDYLLDGVSFKDWIHGTNGMNPSVDAVQEFRTQTSNYPAEFGANAGGVVNMITKSGTNSIRGSAYQYLRDDAFDANNFFSNAVGAEKPPMRRNQFGGAVGGPILQNRTFFFGSYEGFREDRARTLISTLPTAKMHHGDFSELLAQPNPIVIHDPATGQPYPGNIIPADQVLAVMPGYLDTYVPLPTGTGLVQNDVVEGSRKNETDQYMGRVDHTFGPNTQFFTRYAYNTIRDVPINRNPNFSQKESNRDTNLSAQLTQTLGRAPCSRCGSASTSSARSPATTCSSPHRASPLTCSRFPASPPTRHPPTRRRSACPATTRSTPAWSLPREAGTAIGTRARRT